MECLGDDVVLRFAQGQIPEPAANEVQLHVSECEDCRHLVAEASRYFSDHPDTLGSSPTQVDRVRLGGEPEYVKRDGHHVGRYQLQEVIGAGGMGVVYTAFDPQLNRKVALKLVRAASSNAELAAKSRARLIREAQSMAQLQHPNVVTVFDAGTHEGQVFVAMEWVQGDTLKSWLKQQHLDWRGVVDTFIAAGEGLAAAHAAGLVHRDFKPENVLVGSDGRVRVTDFGLARLESMVDAEEGVPLPKTPSGRPASMTETGMLLGTPAYMAPEQLQGQPVDARSDQFSYCVALFEALYGARPFRLTSVTHEAVVFPKGAPSTVVKVLERGLSQAPAARFASMREVISELKEAMKAPVRTRAPLWAAVAVALVAAVGGVVAFRPVATVAPPVAPVESSAAAPSPPPPVISESPPVSPPPEPPPAVVAEPVRPPPARVAPARPSRTRSKPAAAARKPSEAPAAAAPKPAASGDDAPMTNPWGTTP